MSSVLVVDPGPDAAWVAALRVDHQVLRCGGGPEPQRSCPLLRGHGCALADAADVIVLTDVPLASLSRPYRADRQLRAYRSHATYGRLPTVLVTAGSADNGATVVVREPATSESVSAAVEAALATAPATPTSSPRAQLRHQVPARQPRNWA